jgi:AraC family transcriptional regulator
MSNSVWQTVRKELRHRPLVEGRIGGPAPLYAERYLYQDIDRKVSGVRCVALVTQFGGSRVDEGEQDHWRSAYLPAQSLLVPAGVPTHWHYSGPVDYAVFYVLDDTGGIGQRLSLLAGLREAPIPFSDSLVGACARQLTDELQKGHRADRGFMARLADIMLEQAFRMLATPSTVGINPRHVHFSRLQTVLNHIHAQPAVELSAATLARRAGVSLAHFRRIFEDAMHMSPHRYVRSVRLEQARTLLATTTLPIARISIECGFSSQSHLSASFRAAHGATPMQYRRAIGRAHDR